ncbi:hypothetical protein Ancab_005650 [Ancistrocladus abbreviatus]
MGTALEISDKVTSRKMRSSSYYKVPLSNLLNISIQLAASPPMWTLATKIDPKGVGCDYSSSKHQMAEVCEAYASFTCQLHGAPKRISNPLSATTRTDNLDALGR